MALGDRAQSRRGMAVRVLGEPQVGDGVAGEAVGAALEDHELGRMPLEMRLDHGPRGQEFVVARAGRQGQVELAAHGRAGADLVRRTGARVQESPVLVRVGEDQRRVVLEGVEDAIAMVRVDVDVGDARQPVLALQHLDDDSDVVEDAEARGMRAPRRRNNMAAQCELSPSGGAAPARRAESGKP